MKINLARHTLFTILIIFFLNTLAHKFYWYSTIWYFDMPMHFLGGYFLALLMIVLVQKYKFQASLVEKFLIIIFGVFVIAIFWEAFEYIVQMFSTAHLANPIDSMSDIFFGLAGGIFSLICLSRKMLQ